MLVQSNELCLCSRPHTLHGGGNSRSLPSTVTVMPGDVNSPYHKQFVHSKSQQYRRLKTEWRNNVYLRRSNVQVRIRKCTYFISSSQLRLKLPFFTFHTLHIESAQTSSADGHITWSS